MMSLTINAKNHTIEMPSKKYAAAASKYGSSEYIEVQSARRDYPNFKVVTRKTAKRHDEFKGLTYEVMAAYIEKHDKNSQNEATYKFLRGQSEESTHSAYYGEIRAWFLETYPAFGKYPENKTSNANVQ